MILKCSHCGEKMRVDDESVPPGRKVKVRCPHCQGVGIAWLPAAEGDAAAAPAPVPAVEESPHARPATGDDAVIAQQEPPIPADAFNSFRFPSEEKDAESQRPAMNLKWKLLLWIGASAVVIVVFALLVNLILPGPPR